jgi:hypothetical protein
MFVVPEGTFVQLVRFDVVTIAPFRPTAVQLVVPARHDVACRKLGAFTFVDVTVAPLACANASAGANVMPVPPEPEVPTVVIVTVSGFEPPLSTTIVWPAEKFVTLATLTFVAPAAAAAASVVEIGVAPALLACRVQVAPPSVVVTIGGSRFGFVCPFTDA